MKAVSTAKRDTACQATEQSAKPATVSSLSLFLVGLVVAVTGLLIYLYSTVLAGAHVILLPSGVLLILVAIVTSGGPHSPWAGFWRLLALIHATVMLWMLCWDAIFLAWATRAPPLLAFLLSAGGIFAVCVPPLPSYSSQGKPESRAFVRRLLLRGTALTLVLTVILLLLEWPQLLVRITMMFDSPRATVLGVAQYLVMLPVRVVFML